MPLGEQLKTLRKKSGLSQEKVAEAIGVSRQAVTKWESGRSAPSTENLFKLAKLFDTPLDTLIAAEGGIEKTDHSHHLCPQPDQTNAKPFLQRGWRPRIMMALAILGGYLLLYLVFRIFGSNLQGSSVLGWLFSTDPQALSYLYGWLLHNHLFWIAAAFSILLALFGKSYFSVVTFAGFAFGLVLGEFLGVNPAGAALGQGHYGWAIWGGIFLFSLVMGAILEKLVKQQPLSRKKWIIWSGAFVLGVIALVFLVRMQF